MKIVVVIFLFSLLISTSAFSNLNCENFQLPQLKDACQESAKLSEEYLNLSRRDYNLEKAMIMAKVLHAQEGNAIFTVQTATIFNLLTRNYTKKSLDNLKIKTAAAYVDLTGRYNRNKMQRLNLLLPNYTNFEDAIAVELSLPPFRYGHQQIKRLLPTTSLWAFLNNRNKRIYVMKNEFNLPPHLYFYKEGTFKLSRNYCRDKNTFIGDAHKNKEYDQYEACFRYNGPRASNGGATQVCFDHLDRGEKAAYGTGAGYDSYDNVGVARGFDSSYGSYGRYYCSYDTSELITHGFTDLIPYWLD